MPVASRAWRGALIAAGIAAIAALAAPRPVLPPFVPIGDHAAYAPESPRALALVEPVVHAPWFGAAPGAAVALAAALLTGALWAAVRATGTTPLVAAIVVAAWWSRPELRGALGVGADSVVGVGALWAAVVVLLAWRANARATLWPAGLVAVAVASWPPLVVVAPAVAAVAIARGWPVAAGTLAGAALGAYAGVARWASRAATVAGEPVSIADVLVAVAWPEPRGSEPFVWPSVTAALLPIALAVIGAALALRRAPRLQRPLVIVAAAVAVAAPWLLPGWRDELRRAALWAAWPLAGAGLTWLGAQARHPAWVLALVGGVLVAGGVSGSIRDVAGAERRAFAVALEDALSLPDGVPSAAFVAEDTRVDAALLAWGGSRLRRVRPLPALVDEARAGGRVLAGPSARTILEVWGFRLAPVSRITRPDPFLVSEVSGRLRCVPVATPWRELPGLEFTGRLGVQVPPGEGRFEAVVVAPPPIDVHLTRLDGRAAGHVEPLPLDLTTLPPVLWPGEVRLPDRDLVGRRVEAMAAPGQAQALSLTLGRRAPQVAVRFVEPAHLTGVATVCAAPLPRDDVAVGGGRVALDDPAYFAGGWHVVERIGADVFRWTSDRSVLLLPSTAARDVTLAVTARAAAPPAALRVTVNDWVAGERTIAGPPADLTWDIPAAVWADGTNEIVLDISPTARPADAGGTDARRLGAAVTSIRILDRE